MTSHTIDLSKYTLGPNSRDDLVFLARSAEGAERYEDMCQFVKTLIKSLKNDELNVEERNLLSVSYKNAVGARRAARRALISGEHKDNHLIQAYRKALEVELEAICGEILELLTVYLIGRSQNKEVEVFYLKMAGDYCRYLAEFVEGKGYDERAGEFYKRASEAGRALQPTNPIVLGLALNYSVCFYEILKDHKKACEIAKSAFDAAISKLDQLDEASYKDSTLIMQLLRDNLTLWTSEGSD